MKSINFTENKLFYLILFSLIIFASFLRICHWESFVLRRTHHWDAHLATWRSQIMSWLRLLRHSDFGCQEGHRVNRSIELSPPTYCQKWKLQVHTEQPNTRGPADSNFCWNMALHGTAVRKGTRSMCMYQSIRSRIYMLWFTVNDTWKNAHTGTSFEKNWEVCAGAARSTQPPDFTVCRSRMRHVGSSATGMQYSCTCSTTADTHIVLATVVG